MPDANTLAVDTSDLSQEGFLRDVANGLSATHKQLDPKYFYDEAGSNLFEQITRLPEYYITRTETGIMCDIAAELAEACGGTRTIVEFGSGSGQRSELLLDALDQARYYVPIDVSDELLARTSHGVIEACTEDTVHA